MTRKRYGRIMAMTTMPQFRSVDPQEIEGLDPRHTAYDPQLAQWNDQGQDDDWLVRQLDRWADRRVA